LTSSAKVPSAAAIISSGVSEVWSEFASRAKTAWARLIRKVYEPGFGSGSYRQRRRA